jgi:predicted outer membrane repeat protein
MPSTERKQKMLPRYFRKSVLSVICASAMVMATFGIVPQAAVAKSSDTSHAYTGHPAIGLRALAPVTIYADAVNGNDTTGDGTQLNPYQSYTMAVRSAFDGDTVFLMPGTYSSGTTGENMGVGMPAITLQGSGTGNTELQGDADWTVGHYTYWTIFDVDNGGTTTIKDVKISHAGEAAVSSYDTEMVFDNVIFDTNYHDDSGAAIEFSGFDSINEDPAFGLTVTNCRFDNNKCEDDGGAIYMDGAYSADIANNIFADNVADYGAGIYLGTTYRNDPIKIYNDLLYGNDAIDGSCIYVSSGSNASIYNDTLAGNVGGAAVYDDDEDTADYYNLIAWNNEGGDFQYAYPDYSDYSNGPDDSPANIDADPLFIDAANGDYHIQANSPVIGLGINGFNGGYLAPATDLDGVLRPVAPAGVAMGAYEFAAPLAFVNLPGMTAPINIVEGQTIDINPFTIKVMPTSGHGIEKVEFYIDGVLIGTSTTPDAAGVYSCLWDTSLYHSLVRVVAYDNDGSQIELTRNTTVITSLPYTGK